MMKLWALVLFLISCNLAYGHDDDKEKEHKCKEGEECKKEDHQSLLEKFRVAWITALVVLLTMILIGITLWITCCCPMSWCRDDQSSTTSATKVGATPDAPSKTELSKAEGAEAKPTPLDPNVLMSQLAKVHEPASAAFNGNSDVVYTIHTECVIQRGGSRRNSATQEEMKKNFQPPPYQNDVIVEQSENKY